MPPPFVNERYVTVDAGSRSNPERFLGQDYHKLRRDFLQNKARFLDDKFPLNESSIGEGLLSAEDMDKVKWIRPTKMVEDPHLVVDGESRFDFAQGELGNCWFLSAIGAITSQEEIMDQIIPAGQSFRKDYAGIFHFRFWRFGKWLDVVIDDKLPTIDGKLIFVHCKTRNEFWPALLEKAYAKVCGSYADLNGGYVSEALTDFTGGIHVTLRLREARSPLDHWSLIQRATQYRAVMGCGTPQGATPANTELPNGIVEGHAYTVTEVTQVMSKNQQVKLVRLLNPWGHREWNGDWSDSSPLWTIVSDADRTRWLHSKNDGEFWMSMTDFCSSFANVDICCLTPAFLDSSSPSSWSSVQYEGILDERTAESFWKKPPYRVKIPDVDSRGPNLLVSLMQKPQSRHRCSQLSMHIGFRLYLVPPEMKDVREFKESFFSEPVFQSNLSSYTREVMELKRLRPGLYLIVPFTSKPNQSTPYLLTIHSKIKESH